MGTLVRERFQWVDHLRKGLIFLMPDTVQPAFRLREGSNPLEAFLTIALKQPLPKAARAPMRDYIRAWASIGDCEIPRIHIEGATITAEVLFKYRHARGI